MHQQAKTTIRRIPNEDDPRWKGITEYKNPAGTIYYRGYAGISLEGKKILKSYQDFWKAYEWRREKLIEIENHGRQRLDITDELIGKAARLETLCQTHGADLQAAVSYWLRHTRPEGGAVNVSTLKTEYMADPVERSGWTPKHQKHLESLYRHFEDDFGQRLVHDLKAAEITKWILEPKCWGTSRAFKKWSAKTMKNAKVSLASMFAFAVRTKHLVTNPIAEVRLPDVPKAAIRVLSIQECMNLLGTAWRTQETIGLMPYTVICMFAGLRPSETCRVAWSDIRLDTSHPTIRVLENKDGINAVRYVDVCPALAKWLMLFRPESHPGSSILPPSSARANDPFEAVQKRFRRIRQKSKVIDWGRDPMRHSYASYLYSVRQDVGYLRAQLGHENGSPVTLRHYLNRSVVPEEGQKYWELTPQAVLGADKK